MLYEIVIDSRYAGVQCINRFNYTLSGTPAAVTGSFALTMAAGFIPDNGNFPTGTLFHRIRQVQSASVIYREVVVKSIYSNTDFYTLPYTTTVTGLNSQGEDLPPFVCYGLHTNRVRSDIRRGQKRFVGVQEGNTAGAGQIDPTMLAALALLGQKMSEVLTYNDEGNTISFAPVVVGRQKYTPDPSKPGAFAYRYYPTWSEQQLHLAGGILWVPMTTLRSQVSRQYGVGE